MTNLTTGQLQTLMHAMQHYRLENHEDRNVGKDYNAIMQAVAAELTERIVKLQDEQIRARADAVLSSPK